MVHVGCGETCRSPGSIYGVFVLALATLSLSGLRVSSGLLLPLRVDCRNVPAGRVRPLTELASTLVAALRERYCLSSIWFGKRWRYPHVCAAEQTKVVRQLTREPGTAFSDIAGKQNYTETRPHRIPRIDADIACAAVGSEPDGRCQIEVLMTGGAVVSNMLPNV